MSAIKIGIGLPMSACWWSRFVRSRGSPPSSICPATGWLVLGVGSGGFPDSPFWQALEMAPDRAARIPMTARTTEELADVFAAYEAAGADRIVTGPDNGGWKTQLHLIAEARALLD